MEPQERKQTENEILFREVNNTVHAVAVGRRGELHQEYEFLCECSDPACSELVRMTISNYEQIRRFPTRFFVLPGHETERIESVVEQLERYRVVEKTGEAGDLASRWANDGPA